jgi:hypothetical protein
MSRYSRDFESLCQNDLLVQYEEVRYLRAQLASLLFPLKKSPARKPRVTRSNRSTERAVQRSERKVSSPPIQLMMPER